MRKLISLILLLSTLTTYGQNRVKKAYILLDGKPLAYKKFKKIDPSKFSQITVMLGTMI